MSRKRFFDKAYSLRSDAETRAFYEAWAETYDLEVRDENAYQQPVRCASALAELLPPGDVPVLDVGCGTGLSGVALKEAGYGLIDGCDFSGAMLEKATKTGVYRRLFAADLNNPPIDAGDGAYGAATAVGVFSFGHVKAAALDEILRVIRPGGVLIIGVNEHFYDEGSLTAYLERLEARDSVKILSREHGAHLPGKDTTGWVICLRKG